MSEPTLIGSPPASGSASVSVPAPPVVAELLPPPPHAARRPASTRRASRLRSERWDLFIEQPPVTNLQGRQTTRRVVVLQPVLYAPACGRSLTVPLGTSF